MTVSVVNDALNNDLVSDQFVAGPEMSRTALGNSLHVEVREQSFDFHQSQFATAFFGLRHLFCVHW